MAHTVLQRPQRRGLPPQGPRQHRRRRRRTRRRTLRVLAAVVLVGLCLSTASYVRALTYPGQATWQQRSISWLRDHGGSPIVNRTENWYYTRHAPATSPPDLAGLPAAAGAVAAPAGGPHPLPAVSGLPGEGAWVPGRTGRGGQPAAYTSFFQPDPAHASVVAGAAWIRAGATTAHLVTGTTQPGGNGWPGNAQVPPAAVRHLVAVFNSGFKMNDITGGYYSHGRTAKPLRTGQASLVINDHGAASVGEWGRDLTMNSHIISVRQNLALIVDGARPVHGLTANTDQRWGSAANQLQYTWRSGIGTDTAGNLIYVAGDKLTLATLAHALVDAGAVIGMQLDIHPGMAFYTGWTPSQTMGVQPSKLLPTMPGDPARYLSPDQRDFLYLTVG